MKNINGNKPKTSRARFILGAGIGVAISIPLFGDVENSFTRFLLMFGFGAMMGYGQVFAGKNTPGAKKFTRFAIAGSMLAMTVGIVIFLLNG
ncbi:MAG: hypothetical protein HQ477_13820 [Chloroflexi bacterium]|nr:hypothetical protein [Chloroflexota bacterium]